MRSHLILSLIAAATMAACSSTPETKPAPAPAAPAPAAAPAAPAAKPAPAPAAKVDPYDPSQLNNPASLLSKRSVFFAYDKFDVSEDYQPLVVTHALFLTKNPSYKIVIQGNADERGSSEYNLALGQKRADAVKAGLVALGVSAGQIETISFGKEKPRNTGSDEVAWAENRRADIVYQGK